MLPVEPAALGIDPADARREGQAPVGEHVSGGGDAVGELSVALGRIVFAVQQAQYVNRQSIRKNR